MLNIYSNIDPSKLLHKIVYLEDFEKGRVEIIKPDQFIQCAALNMDKGKTFKPHFHLWKESDKDDMTIAQESWHVIKGSVKCIFYDIDNSCLGSWILRKGDTSFSLYGGHNYEVLEDETFVLEYKTGPYLGQELDKAFINE